MTELPPKASHTASRANQWSVFQNLNSRLPCETSFVVSGYLVFGMYVPTSPNFERRMGQNVFTFRSSEPKNLPGRRRRCQWQHRLRAIFPLEGNFGICH